MKRKNKGNWLCFSLFMTLYAIFILAAASVGLKLLWDFCENYEQSLPSRKMNEYVSSLTEKRVKKLSVDFVATLDHNIQSDEEAYAEIWRCFTGAVHYRRLSSDSEDRLQYAILNGDQQLGTVTLVRNPDKQGDKTWSVEKEEYDFSFLIRSKRFTIPEHWVVICGKRRLGVQYIVDPRVHYPFIEEFYDKGFPMPYLSEYEIGNYIGDPQMTFFDPDGVEQAPFVLTDGREQTPRAGRATSGMIMAFTDQFIPLYINCLANTTRTANYNYNKIKPLLVPDSEIDRRLKGAIGGQVFAQSRATAIKGMTVHDVFDLGNTFYLIDLSFTVDTTTAKGNSETETNMFLAVEVEEETVKAVMVMLY